MPQTYKVPTYIKGTATGTLGGAAQEMDISLQQLLEANPQYEANPNLVQAGAVLNYPTATPTSPTNTTITADMLASPQSAVNLGSPVISPTSPIINDTQTSPTEDPMQWFKDYLATQTAPPSGAEAYEGTYGAVDTPEQIAQKEAAVKVSTDKISALNAQIQGIVNSATQAQLTLESQAGGKDVTSTFLGRQQQEISRQAAIQVLPLQTQVLTEQAALTGNTALLTQAQGKVDTYFSYKMQDAQNQYEYQQNIISKFFDYASKSQQAKLNDKRTEDAQKFTLLRDNLNNARDVANSLLQTQPELASKIMQIDWSQPDAIDDFARLQTQIKPKPITPKAIVTPVAKTFTSGGLVIVKSDIAKAQRQLDMTKGADGYVNTPTYIQMLEAWKKDGGLEQDFFQQFPPKNYLNPKDATVPKYIRDKLKITEGIDNPFR